MPPAFCDRMTSGSPRSLWTTLPTCCPSTHTPPFLSSFPSSGNVTFRVSSVWMRSVPVAFAASRAAVASGVNQEAGVASSAAFCAGVRLVVLFSPCSLNPHSSAGASVPSSMKCVLVVFLATWKNAGLMLPCRASP